MASSRRTGTNEAILTYNKAGGKQYSSLATWEADFTVTLTSGFHKITCSDVSGTLNPLENCSFSGGADATYQGHSGSAYYFKLVSGSISNGETFTGDVTSVTGDADTVVSSNTGICPVLEIYGTEADDYVAIAGATTSTTYFRIVRAASTNYLTSGAISSHHFASTNVADFCAVTESYSKINDIVAKITINNASDRRCFYTSSTGVTFAGSVAIDCSNAASGRNIIGFHSSLTAATGVVFANCLAHNNDGDGFRLYSNYDARISYAYNCTATNNAGIGFYGENSARAICKNCGSNGNGTEYSGPTWTNSSTDAPTFASGTDNFHLASTDTAWKDLGGDLSGDSTFAFDDDIDFQTRTGSWDIGFDEYIATGVTVPVFMRTYQNMRT